MFTVQKKLFLFLKGENILVFRGVLFDNQKRFIFLFIGALCYLIGKFLQISFWEI